MVYTDNDYRRAANLTLILAGIAAAFYLLFKHLIPAASPILLAIPISALISPWADRIAEKAHLPRKMVAILLLLLFFSGLGALLYLASSKLISEVGDLLERLSTDPNALAEVSRGVEGLLSSVTHRFGFLQSSLNENTLSDLGVDLSTLISSALTSLASSLTAKLSGATVGAFSAIPSILFFAIVFLISSFYLTADRQRILSYLTALLPQSWQNKLPALKKKTSLALTGYLKAYFFIMLLTFLEVFIGLTILRAKYALLMSLIIAAVDVLPILGAGAILLPWAGISYFTGDPRLGTGLLILYAVVLILRQIEEPRIVGDSIGLHPLATLASVYLGIKFAGLFGILLGPIAALLIKSLLSPTGEEEQVHRQSPAQ